jgi:hypothetical protein
MSLWCFQSCVVEVETLKKRRYFTFSIIDTAEKALALRVSTSDIANGERWVAALEAVGVGRQVRPFPSSTSSLVALLSFVHPRMRILAAHVPILTLALVRKGLNHRLTSLATAIDGHPRRSASKSGKSIISNRSPMAII